MGGQNFQMHPGSTKSLLLNLTLPGDTRVHILKLRRSKGSPLRQFVDERSHNINAAVSKLIDMCDVGNIFARLIRGPVRVVWTNEDGNRGRYVNDDAWMDEMADGASAEMMLIHRADIFDLVFPRTKASDWYRAAFFDTLTLQGANSSREMAQTGPRRGPCATSFVLPSLSILKTRLAPFPALARPLPRARSAASSRGTCSVGKGRTK